MSTHIPYVMRPAPRVTARTRLFNGTRQLLAFTLSLYLLGLAMHLVLRLLLGDRFRLLAIANLMTPYYFLPLVLVLPMALLARLRRVTLGACILSLIWIAAYGPRFIPRTATASEGTSLSIATWNVYRRNADVAEIIGWLQQEDADVVLLQELPRLTMEQILDGTEASYPYRKVNEPRDGGMVTLSHLPILEADSFSLTDDGRVEQRLTIEVQGQTVVIYNIHLANPIPVRPMPWYRRDAPFLLHLIDSYDDSQRDVEVEMLLERIATEQQPLIVAGDFNMSDQSAIYQDVAARLHDTFAEVGLGLGTSWPATDTKGLPAFVPPLLRLDYIWHSAEWTSVSAAVGTAPGSDHLSVSAVLALRP